jgi:hypothetical protein
MTDSKKNKKNTQYISVRKNRTVKDESFRNLRKGNKANDQN